MDTPGVRVPPPLIYLAAILLGAGIDRFAPVPILPSSITAGLGGALVVGGVIISGLSVREFRKARTTIRPDQPVSRLVTTGPFRYVRNPMYLGLSVVHIGIGIWMNSAWVLVLLIPAVAWINARVIAREERYLRERFGQAYVDYQGRARRWL